MCPKSKQWPQNQPDYIDPAQLDHEGDRPLPSEPLESGSMDSPGPTGRPLPLVPAGVQLVRHHKGRATTLVGSLILNVQGAPAIFSALKRETSGVYTVTLSCDLTSSQYGALISTLEGSPMPNGKAVSVAVEFEPMTPNLVPVTTAPSTSPKLL